MRVKGTRTTKARATIVNLEDADVFDFGCGNICPFGCFCLICVYLEKEETPYVSYTSTLHTFTTLCESGMGRIRLLTKGNFIRN